MNELIKELELKAYVETEREWIDPSSNYPQMIKVKEFSRQKFAELIVEECIREIGYKSAELLDIDFYPHYQERLKKYFGIEC